MGVAKNFFLEDISFGQGRGREGRGTREKRKRYRGKRF